MSTNTVDINSMNRDFLGLCLILVRWLFLTPARGPPPPAPGTRVGTEPPRPAAAPKFGHLIVKCVKGIELKVLFHLSR